MSTCSNNVADATGEPGCPYRGLVGQVIKHKGVAQATDVEGLNHESLYKAITVRGNPGDASSIC